MLDQKVEEAISLISDNIVNPVVMSSFGKDSMVMLDLIRKAGFKFPILFFREPFHPKKYEFSNKVILDNNYVVYDYPPIDNAISKNGNTIEIINLYQLHDNPLRVIYVPTGISTPKDFEEYLCGLRDIYEKPKCSYNFPWNTIFIGHKSTDKDPVLGGIIELNTDMYFDKSCDKTIVFPLRFFTDEDIWNYTIRENLPINYKRYNKDNNWKEFEDITYNPDYFYACTRCIDNTNEDRVFCPRLNKIIPNISDSIIFLKAELPSYAKVVGEK